MILALINIFFEIITWPIFNGDNRIIHDLAVQLKTLQDKQKLILNEFQQLNNINEINENLRNVFEIFSQNINKHQTRKLIKSDDWITINENNEKYFSDKLSPIFANIEPFLLSTMQELVDHNIKVFSLITDEIQDLILVENTSTMYNLSRIIDAISIFDKNPVADRIQELLPQTEDWKEINNLNYFAKLELRPLVYKELTESSQVMYKQELELTQKLLKESIKRYV